MNGAGGVHQVKLQQNRKKLANITNPGENLRFFNAQEKEADKSVKTFLKATALEGEIPKVLGNALEQSLAAVTYLTDIEQHNSYDLLNTLADNQAKYITNNSFNKHLSNLKQGLEQIAGGVISLAENWHNNNLLTYLENVFDEAIKVADAEGNIANSRLINTLKAHMIKLALDSITIYQDRLLKFQDPISGDKTSADTRNRLLPKAALTTATVELDHSRLTSLEPGAQITDTEIIKLIEAKIAAGVNDKWIALTDKNNANLLFVYSYHDVDGNQKFLYLGDDPNQENYTAVLKEQLHEQVKDINATSYSSQRSFLLAHAKVLNWRLAAIDLYKKLNQAETPPSAQTQLSNIHPANSWDKLYAIAQDGYSSLSKLQALKCLESLIEIASVENIAQSLANLFDQQVV